jgi:hypothetical protein
LKIHYRRPAAQVPPPAILAGDLPTRVEWGKITAGFAADRTLKEPGMNGATTRFALGLAVIAVVAAFSADRSRGQEATAPTDWAAGVVLPAGEQAVLLFNGRDLTGWEGRTDKIWTVADGVIVGRNDEPVAVSTYLFTRESYRDFRLLLEVQQTVREGFSTVHSAVAALGEKFADQGETYSFKGPLLMFCKDWGIWEVNGRDRLFPAGHRGTLQHAAEKDGQWNQIEILVIGPRIRLVANGQLVTDYTESQPDRLNESPLGLQLHSTRQPSEYRFRGLILSKNPVDRLLTSGDVRPDSPAASL